MKKLFSIMSNLQTHCDFKLDYQNMDQHTGNWLIYGTKDTTRTISCKAWNSPVENPSRKFKHDSKESEENMFNPIFHENVQGRKHTGRCTFAESALLSSSTLQWRHNGHDNVSNHQPRDCLLNRLFRRISKKTSKLTASLAFVRGIHRTPGNSPHKWPVTRKMFPFHDVIMK